MDLEKQIEEVAIAFIGIDYDSFRDKCNNCFVLEVKSEVAKEYWQQEMFTRQQLNKAVEIGINEELRKQQEMYTEKEVLGLISAALGRFSTTWTVDSILVWFEQNKKK